MRISAGLWMPLLLALPSCSPEGPADGTGQSSYATPPPPTSYDPDLAARALATGRFVAWTEDTAGGHVDWTGGTIRAEGLANAKGTTAQDIAMARRAAP